jgi:hypothetical protein
MPKGKRPVVTLYKEQDGTLCARNATPIRANLKCAGWYAFPFDTQHFHASFLGLGGPGPMFGPQSSSQNLIQNTFVLYKVLKISSWRREGRLS